jgi:molybdopterin-biosynthesis enzyme MoeA-like protein
MLEPAKAFGVTIDVDPRALAILHEWLKATGFEMSEARMRMTRIPKGADLVLNQVSGAPGFWIGNVIVLAGVPSIMQAMLDEVGPKLKIGIRLETLSFGERLSHAEVLAVLSRLPLRQPIDDQTNQS